MRAWKTILPALLLWSGASEATTLVPRDRVCPVGGEHYKSFSIASTSSFGMRLDLRPMGVSAYLPHIECPNGFIVFKDETEFTPAEIDRLAAVVASPAFQDARKTDVPSARLAMLDTADGAAPDVVAWAWLKAAFEAEDAGNEALRQKHLAEAAATYEAELTAHPTRDKAWWIAMVQLAEIARQQGRFDKAIAIAGALKNPPDDDAWLGDVAAQIRDAAKLRIREPLAYRSH